MTNDIYIYKPIGERTEDNWAEVITAEDIANQIGWIDGEEVRVHVNCPGGSYFSGMAIFHSLNACEKKIIMIIEGMAASMASIIILAGNEIVMSPFARIMTHRICGQASGNADTIRMEADQMEKFEQSMLEIYGRRTGLTSEECRTKFMADTDTWFTAEEAVAAKLADRIEEGTLKAPMKEKMNDPMMFYQSCAALLQVPNQSKDMDFLKTQESIPTW